MEEDEEVALRYAYFMGCVPQSSCRELDAATEKVCRSLDIGLERLEDATCCGGDVISRGNSKLADALNARTFAMAERLKLNIMTICNTCQWRLTESNLSLKNNPRLLAEVNEAIGVAGYHYGGNVEVKHMLQILLRDVGLERVRGTVKSPLEGVRVAPFYGCQILRPSTILNFDDPDNPRSLEQLIATLGAEPVKYPERLECCGFQLMTIDEVSSFTMSGRRMMSARKAGADAMVTPCPLCHLQLDLVQPRVEKVMEEKIGMPIIHLPQLMGLAMGMTPRELGLKKHVVSTGKFLKKLGLK